MLRGYSRARNQKVEAEPVKIAFTFLLAAVMGTAAFVAGNRWGHRAADRWYEKRDAIYADSTQHDYVLYAAGTETHYPPSKMCGGAAVYLHVVWPDGKQADLCTTDGHVYLPDWKTAATAKPH